LVIWWKGQEHNGDLMLLMAHLLSVSKTWSGSTISLKSVVEDAKQAQAVRTDFEDLLPRIRISAKVNVIVRPPDKTYGDVIRAHSAKADLIFLGLAMVPSGSEEDYAKRLIALLEGLPSAILVRNAGPFRGRLV